MLFVKILIFLIPVIIGIFDRKKIRRAYLVVISIFTALGIANEWYEYDSKKTTDEQNLQLSQTVSSDNIQIGKLLKYDTLLAQSNGDLKDSANSLLRLNCKIKSKLDAIELALANSPYKYEPGEGIVPKNGKVAKEENITVDNKKSINNFRPISYYQERISSLNKQTKQYDPVLKKDSANLKEASDIHWYKLRNKDKIKTEIDIARLKLYNDATPVRVINDSIAYYKTRLAQASSK